MDNYLILIVLTGCLLDLIIGDPAYRFHPVRLIGNTIIFFEKLLYNLTFSKIFNGLVFFLVIVSGWSISIYLLLYFINTYLYLYIAASIFMIYSLISIKDLKVKADEVKVALKSGDLITAREKVGMIVGRDTDNLDKKEIVRATVETVAENIVDGIISPLFYLLVAGVPGMVLYKAVNTLDSMIGYRNVRYEMFGKISARLDDLLNYIPARLSPILISIGGWFVSGFSMKGIQIAVRDGDKNPSPNAGISEATVAGLMGVRLGGENFYKGKVSIKPYIGNKLKELDTEDIEVAYRISTFTGIVCFIIVLLLLHFNGGFLLNI